MKFDWQKILLAIATVLALIFSYTKYGESNSLSQTVTSLQAQNRQVEAYSDSLLATITQYDEEIHTLKMSNQELKGLNQTLSKYSKQKQKVKYITTSTITQQIKDSISNLVYAAALQRRTIDSLYNALQEREADLEDREATLWEALSKCYSKYPEFPWTYENSTPYYNYDFTVLTADSAQVNITTQDTLSFAHSVSRKWFLGRRTYSVFAKSASPYSLTDTYSYSFSNKKTSPLRKKKSKLK